jgi:outer membrane protein
MSRISFFITFAVISGFACSSYSIASEIKIGTVDMQKALQSVEAGKRAKAQLEKDFNAKKKELQTEESAIKKMSEAFRKQEGVMSDPAKAKKQAELQERIMKFQELTGRSQAEIQQKERDLTQPIIVKLRGIIAEAAKKGSYTVVLEKNENNVLYSLEKDDMTTEVVATFDKQDKVASAPVPPAVKLPPVAKSVSASHSAKFTKLAKMTQSGG